MGATAPLTAHEAERQKFKMQNQDWSFILTLEQTKV